VEEEKGGWLTGKPQSEKTLQATAAAIRMLFDGLVVGPILATNPAHESPPIPKPAAPSKTRRRGLLDQFPRAGAQQLLPARAPRDGQP